MPSKEKPEYRPLDKKEMKFVEWFRKYRDIYKAAERAGITKGKAVATFNRPEVQDELERQEEAIRQERAKLTVETEALCNEVIDRELMKVILMKAETHGSLKLDAIRLGAVMTGRIQAGNTKSLAGGGEERGPGNFYQALVQVTEAPAPILPETPLSATAIVAAIKASLPVTPPPAVQTPPAPPNPSKRQPAANPAGSVRIG